MDLMKWLLVGAGAWVLYEFLNNQNAIAAAPSAPASPATPASVTGQPLSINPTGTGQGYTVTGANGEPVFTTNLPLMNPPAGVTPTSGITNPFPVGSTGYLLINGMINSGAPASQINAAIQNLQALAGSGAVPGSGPGLQGLRQISREAHDRLQRAAMVTRSGGTPRQTNPPVLRLPATSRARIVSKNYWGNGARSSRQIPYRWVQ